MEQEFEKVISENRLLILHICRLYRIWNGRETEEDLYQEIVLNLWKGFPKFHKISNVKHQHGYIELRSIQRICKKETKKSSLIPL